ncbi:hypothetical protein Hypma_013505 [Hypsizygus marmoreus]|uniref:Uncharacterized protein n=1 Tax=Hypsizygus marmoreus TaxID=39966 RepID=A0A369JFS4_HYPMA|nr:hypothetical protein Hypma_013505 [Hypsizygus marmoreus]
MAAGGVKKVTRKRMRPPSLQQSSTRMYFLSPRSGWIGSNIPGEGSREFTLEELTGPEFKMRLVEWDGTTSMPIVDAEGQVIGIFSGRPRGPDYQGVVAEVTSEFALARVALGVSGTSPMAQRRGNFYSLVVGISFGGGQRKPANLHSSKSNVGIVDALLRSESKSLSRIADFASGQLLNYRLSVIKVLMHDSTLWRNFDRSVFAAATFNLGPITMTCPHLDQGNLAWGWCAITALGTFDANRGGHMVLWDLGLVIQFLPGSTILISSAILKHSNVKVPEGEIRCSFTQYTAGGLLRYAYNGFWMDKTVLACADKAEMDRRKMDRQRRWADGLDMFSSIDKLLPL